MSEQLVKETDPGTVVDVRKPILLASVLALLAGLSVGFGILLRGGPAGAGPDYYARNLDICNPGERGVASANQLGESQQCLATLMTQAFKVGDLETFLPVLEQKVSASETLYTICHPAAHIAGRAALDGGPGVIELLDIVAVNTVCDWGFGHGVIDSLAERGRDDEVLDNIVAWCDKHSKNKRLYELCSDSVGHYSWTSTQDLMRSIANCEKIEQHNGVTSCGGGIMMQLFEPAAGTGTYDRAKAPELIPQICTTWMAAATTVASRNGCATGAGYIFGLEVRDAIWPWLNSPERSARLNPVPQEHQERIISVTREALRRCDFFKGEALLICGGMVTGAIPYLYASDHPDALEELCAIFEDDVLLERCLARRTVGNI